METYKISRPRNYSFLIPNIKSLTRPPNSSNTPNSSSNTPPTTRSPNSSSNTPNSSFNAPPTTQSDNSLANFPKFKNLLISEESENSVIYNILINKVIIGFTSTEENAKNYVIRLSESLLSQKCKITKSEDNIIELSNNSLFGDKLVYSIKYEKTSRLI